MSVEKLIEALREEAATREAEVSARAAAEREAILADAARTVDRMRAEREAEMARREENRRRVEGARRTLDGRRREIALQQAAAHALREGARERWRRFMAGPEYPPFVKRNWEKTVALLGNVGEVRADPVTARALGGTGAPAPRIDPSVDDGFVAVSSDGEVEAHDRFAVRLQRLWERQAETFAAPLAKGVTDVL